MRAFVNTFRASGQTSLFDLLLHYSFIACPPSLPSFLIYGSPFSLALFPPATLYSPQTLPALLSLSKVYILLLTLGGLPSLVYLLLIIVFSDSVTCSRWMFEMSFVSWSFVEF